MPNEKFKLESGALKFMKSRKYLYSTNKLDIPNSVIDSISRINNEKFRIGDNSDSGKISFSDVSIGNYEYKRKLHFVLVSDTFCLITYTEGGMGTHDVIDYFQYKGCYNQERYSTLGVLRDTSMVENYLSGDGQK